MSKLQSNTSTAFVVTLFLGGLAQAQGSQRLPNSFGAPSTSRPAIVGAWPNFNAVWASSGTGGVVAHSGDGGVTWSQAGAVPSLLNTTSIDVAQDGLNVIIAYHDATPNVFAHTSVDGGATWTPPLASAGSQINDTGLAGINVRCMAVDGKFFVTYMTPGSPNVLRIDEASYASTPSWVTSDQIAANFVASAYELAGHSGAIGILWRAPFSPLPLKFRSRESAGGTWSPAVDFDLAAGVTSDLDLAATDNNGAPQFHALYTIAGTRDVRHSSGVTTFPDPMDPPGTPPTTTFATPTTVTLGTSAHLGTAKSLCLAASLESGVHAFFAVDFGGGAYRLGHKEVFPTPGTVTYLNGTITAASVGVDPIGFCDGDIVGCCWNERLSSNPNTSALDPLFNLSEDGGQSWLDEPRSLIPGFYSATSSKTAAAAVSRSSVSALYHDNSGDMTAIGLVSYGVLPISGTGSDAPQVGGRGLTIQDPLTPTTVTFETNYMACGANLPLIGFLILTLGTPAQSAPLGPCNILVEPLPFEAFGFLFPGNQSLHEFIIPAGTIFEGTVINAQALAIGTACGSSCLGTTVSVGNAIDFVVTIL